MQLCPIVMACDENFAMPLATALRSLAESNARHWPLQVTVLTDHFSDEGKRRVHASLPVHAVTLRWQVVDVSRYRSFRPMSYLSAMTYARFQIEDCFDANVGRVVYLDADTLVFDDIAYLAQVSLDGAAIGAVPDEYIDDVRRRGVEPDQPGVPRVSRYFNAGVLVIDLQKWRAYQVARRAVEYLSEFPASPYSDQDALNVACDGIWHELDRRWNFQGHRQLRINQIASSDRPAVVHFITSDKPWKSGSLSLNATLYESFRDRTAFKRSAMEKLSAFNEMLFRRVRRRLLHLLGR